MQFVSASDTFFGGTITTIPGQVIFGLGFTFSPGNVAILTINVIPTNSGPLNDVVTIGTQGANDSVTVSNFNFAANPVANLGVAITGPSVAVLANDWMTYSVTVTNTGSNSANNVVLSNTLPAGVGLIGVTPATPPFTVSSNVMVFNLGSMSAGAADVLLHGPTHQFRHEHFHGRRDCRPRHQHHRQHEHHRPALRHEPVGRRQFLRHGLQIRKTA